MYAVQARSSSAVRMVARQAAPGRVKCEAHASLEPQSNLAAQHARGVDAAARPQARGFFEGWKQLNRVPDRQGGATHAQAVGPHSRRTSQGVMYVFG